MKVLNTLLFLAVLVLTILSLFYIFSSIDTLLKGNRLTPDNVYFFISKYSGLYKFTFIVLAIGLTLRQIRFAQETNQGTLQQLKVTQEDINYKKSKEILNDTLIHCQYYYTEIQTCLRDLTVLGALNRMPTSWDSLETIEYDSLKKNASDFQIVYDNAETHRREILLALYKMEAFAARFVRGNLDLELGKEMIGYTFYFQTEMWLGLIAFFRQNNASPFCKDLLELKNRWKP